MAIWSLASALGVCATEAAPPEPLVADPAVEAVVEAAAAPAAQAAADLRCQALDELHFDATAGTRIDYADQVAACGHLELAEALYRDVLAKWPPPALRLQALEGLAAVLTGLGRQHEAAEVLASLIEHGTRTARGTALQVLSGHPALSRAARPRFDPVDDGAAALLGDRSLSTDTLGVRAERSETRWTQPDGRSSISARMEDVRYETQDRSLGARVTKPGLRIEQRLADNVNINGDLTANRMEVRGAGEAPTRLSYNTGVRVTHGDVLRLSVGSNRVAPDNIVAFRRENAATTNSAVFDVLPTADSRVSMRLTHALNPDGSQRTATQLDTEHQVGLVSGMWVGAKATVQEFEPAQAGAAPASFASSALTMRMESTSVGHYGRLGYGVSIGVGDGLLSQAPGKPRYDLALRGSYRLVSGTTFEAKLQSVRAHASQLGPAAHTVVGLSLVQPW